MLRHWSVGRGSVRRVAVPDPVDVRVLAVVAESGKAAIADIAGRLGMDPREVAARLLALSASGLPLLVGVECDPNGIRAAIANASGWGNYPNPNYPNPNVGPPSGPYPMPNPSQSGPYPPPIQPGLSGAVRAVSAPAFAARTTAFPAVLPAVIRRPARFRRPRGSRVSLRRPSPRLPPRAPATPGARRAAPPGHVATSRRARPRNRPLRRRRNVTRAPSARRCVRKGWRVNTSRST